MIKVAIFGGSFDPPHKGHQHIVNRALAVLDIDKLIIVPTFLNPFKISSLASSNQRVEWCHQLFDDIPRVEVSDYEVKLAKPVYTSISLQHFQKLYDVKYIIIGADNLTTINRWHKFEWINQEIEWVIATREDCPLETQLLNRYNILEISTKVSSTDIRECNDLRHIDKRIAQKVSTIINENKEKHDNR